MVGHVKCHSQMIWQIHVDRTIERHLVQYFTISLGDNYFGSVEFPIRRDTLLLQMRSNHSITPWIITHAHVKPLVSSYFQHLIQHFLESFIDLGIRMLALQVHHCDPLYKTHATFLKDSNFMIQV